MVKPGYLVKYERTAIQNRWKVVEVEPERMTTDELSIYTRYGTPKYIRLYWDSKTKKIIYEWIYENPLRIFWLQKGRIIENPHVIEYNPWWK